MRRDIILLGATGSIGRQTLEILKFSLDYSLVGICFDRSIDVIEGYLLYFPSLKYVAIRDERSAAEFKKRHVAYQVFSGKDCIKQLYKSCKGADVFNALSTIAGLPPTIDAIKEDRDLMLANKESLVMGSSLIKPLLKDYKGYIYPVDSEHVALAKIIKSLKEEGIDDSSIISYQITASGGALRDRKDLIDVRKEEVLSHPTWKMSNKITIDCATLINKAYEIIEANALFDIPFDRLDAKICRESLIHARVIYKGSAGKVKERVEYSPVDMKVSINYALSKGKEKIHQNNADDIKRLKQIKLLDIDHKRYPCFDIVLDAYKRYGNIALIYIDAVDRKAIDQYLDGDIDFLDITDAIRYTYEHFQCKDVLSIEDLEEISLKADNCAESLLGKLRSNK